MPFVKFSTTSACAMHTEATDTAMMCRTQHADIFHSTVAACGTFCLHTIDKESIVGGGI